MPTLLLRLSGPMQSWGTRSRFDDRDTERLPSKSGVIGLLCAAQGRPRSASIDDLAPLRMGVRADRPGILATDFHTAKDVARASSGKQDTVVSRRHYLSDAVFLVGLAGDERLLRELEQALRRPVWPLGLGRKSFVPGEPVALPDGLRAGELEVELPAYPWLGRGGRQRPLAELEVQWECSPGDEGELRQDVPLSFATRRFGVRRVRTGWVPCPAPWEESHVSEPTAG